MLILILTFNKLVIDRPLDILGKSLELQGIVTAVTQSLQRSAESRLVTPDIEILNDRAQTKHTKSSMAPRICVLCDKAKAMLKRPKTGQQICRDCFFYVFETEVHNTITKSNLFNPGDRVAIGASGGKGTNICSTITHAAE